MEHGLPRRFQRNRFKSPSQTKEKSEPSLERTPTGNQIKQTKNTKRTRIKRRMPIVVARLGFSEAAGSQAALSTLTWDPAELGSTSIGDFPIWQVIGSKPQTPSPRSSSCFWLNVGNLQGLRKFGKVCSARWNIPGKKWQPVYLLTACIALGSRGPNTQIVPFPMPLEG